MLIYNSYVPHWAAECIFIYISYVRPESSIVSHIIDNSSETACNGVTKHDALGEYCVTVKQLD